MRRGRLPARMQSYLSRCECVKGTVREPLHAQGCGRAGANHQRYGHRRERPYLFVRLHAHPSRLPPFSLRIACPFFGPIRAFLCACPRGPSPCGSPRITYTCLTNCPDVLRHSTSKERRPELSRPSGTFPPLFLPFYVRLFARPYALLTAVWLHFP